MSDQNRHLLALSAQIVAAHAGHNPVGIDALPDMIRNVYQHIGGHLGPHDTQISAATHRIDGARYPDQHNHADGHTYTCTAHNGYVHPDLRADCLRRSPDLHGGWAEHEDAEAASIDSAWHDARRIPGEMGPAGELSDGRCGICQTAIQFGVAERSWSEARGSAIQRAKEPEGLSGRKPFDANTNDLSPWFTRAIDRARSLAAAVPG